MQLYQSTDVFPKWNRNSLNSANSENRKNQWCKKWGLCYLCTFLVLRLNPEHKSSNAIFVNNILQNSADYFKKSSNSFKVKHDICLAHLLRNKPLLLTFGLWSPSCLSFPITTFVVILKKNICQTSSLLQPWDFILRASHLSD